MTSPQETAEGTSDRDAATAETPYRWRWLAFAAVLLASVMDLLDALIANVAAPSIRADLGGGDSLVQWVGAGYILALAAGLLTGGRLGDLWGRRRMFVVGVVGFTVASVACAAAVSPAMLIGARVAQGLFGAVLLPQGLGVIRSVFPAREQALAFGAYGPAMGLASVAGPVVAGALVTADLFGSGWRAIFLVNVPLGIVALVLGLRFIPADGERSAARIDLVGALLAGVAGLLLVFPIVRGRELDWPAWTCASIAAGLAVFGAFAWHEARTGRLGRDPLVVPSLFGNRSFVGGLLTGLSAFAAMVGFSLVLTVFLQVGHGFSALDAGLTVLPQAIGSVLGFIVSGAGLATRLGRRCLHLGLVVMALGALGTLVVLHADNPDVSAWHTAPTLAVYGAGLGLFLAPFFDIVLAGVRPHEYGSASGTLTATQQFGSALGIAVVGTVFFHVVAAGTPTASSAASVFADAFDTAITTVAGLLALTFALAFLLPRHAAADPSTSMPPDQRPGGTLS